MDVLEKIERTRERARNFLARVADERALEEWRIEFLGRKSETVAVLRSLGDLVADLRRKAGEAANALKTELEDAYRRKQEELAQAKIESASTLGRIDVTLPARPVLSGRLHPITQTQRDIVDAFVAQGYSVIEGPEVELDYYNFEALRIPRDHPARELMDTFYIEGGSGADQKVLLRTHTSPNQIRFMEKNRPPIRIVCPGRTYRNEATDPTHEWMIQQVEVLAVDEPELAVRDSDIVATCTDATRVVFDAPEWLKEGAHITCVRACEVGPRVLQKCDVSVKLGRNTIEAMDAGMVRLHGNVGYIAGQPEERARIPNPVVDNYKGDYFKYFMDVRGGSAPGRTSDRQVTFFIIAGTQGLQFAACAGKIVELAKQKKVGRELPTEWFLQNIRD